jgi:hypothetical protein
MNRQTYPTEIQAKSKHTDMQTGIETERSKTYIQIDRKTDRQIGGQTDR